MKLSLKLIISVGTLLVAGQFLTNATASAAGGRADNHGYFTDVQNTGHGDFVLPGGTVSNPSIPNAVDSIAEFKSFVEGQEASGTTWNHIGGAFIIQTMRGSSATPFGWDRNSSLTSAEINDWEDRLDSLIANGGHVVWNGTYGYCTNSFNIHNHGVDSNPDDDAYYHDCDTEGDTILFEDKNNNILYAIKHRCANPVGDLNGLPKVPKWKLAPQTTVDKTTMYPGGTATFTHTIDRSQGPDTATGIDYKAYYQIYDASGTLKSSSSISTITKTNVTLVKSNADYAAGKHAYVSDSAIKPGSKICELLRVYDYRHPIQGQNSADSDEKCVIIVAVSKILDVTLMCNKSTLSGTISDPQKSNSVALSYYMEGKSFFAIPSSVNASSGSASFSIDVASLIADGKNHVFQVRASAAKETANSQAATCKLPPPVTSNCPPGSETQPVTLTPQGSGLGSEVTGFASAPGQTYDRNIANGNFSIDSVADQYGQAGGFSPAGKSQNPNFKVKYDDYISQYPYDTHKPTVKYQTYYDSVTYTSAKDPYYDESDTCNGYADVVHTGTFTWTTPPTPYTYTSYDCTGYTHHKVFRGYAIYESRRTKDAGSYSSSMDATPLPECLLRNYKVENPAQTDLTGNPSFLPSDEDPSSVTIGTHTSVTFSLTGGGLGVRVRTTVKDLAYKPNYYIQHANGSQTPLDDSSFSPDYSYNGSSNFIGTGTVMDRYNPSLSISVPTLQVGDKICAEFTITPQTGQVDENGVTQPGTSAGSVNSSAASGHCTAPVVNQPYVRVYNSSVSAGGGFGTGSCGVVGTIQANGKGDAPLTRGSAVQIGALALGSIGGMASASLRSASSPTALAGLSFANATVTSVGAPSNPVSGYGGNMGGRHCIPDYYGLKPSAAGGGPIDVTSPGSKSYSLPAGSALSGLNLGRGVRRSIFVDGDVNITGDMNFASSAGGSTDDVPSLFIIAKGNIYISPGVHHLDGVFIAQGTNGIDTCASGFGSLPAGVLYNNCNSQLLITGSFIANHIRLDRSYSSLRHSVNAENPGGPSHFCDAQNGNPTDPQTDCSAEIFQFSPETYIGLPALDTSQPGPNRYDYITSLSPVL